MSIADADIAHALTASINTSTYVNLRRAVVYFLATAILKATDD
jgi:hypothetical protein